MSNPIRLVLIGSHPYKSPPVGGVESAYVALLKLLFALEPSLEVDVLAYGTGEPEVLYDGRLRVHGVLGGDYSLARLRGFPKERQAVNEFVAKLRAPTIISAIGNLMPLAIDAAKPNKHPTLVTIHGIPERDIRLEKRNRIVTEISAFQLASMMRYGIRQATRVIAISGYSAEYAHNMGRTGPVDVVPNPIDPIFENATYTPNPTRNRLIFGGNIQPLKGLHVLLEAMAHMTRQSELLIAGPVADASYAQGLKEQAERLGLGERVQWLGSLKKPALLAQMQHSDLMVLPSQIENLPQILQEAATMGLPFVASDVGGVRDLAPKDLRKHVLVPANDANALAKQLDAALEPSTRATLGAGLQQHVRRECSNAVVAQKTLAVYRELLPSMKSP